MLTKILARELGSHGVTVNVRRLGEPSPTKPSGLAAKLSSWFK